MSKVSFYHYSRQYQRHGKRILFLECLLDKGFDDCLVL
jgi:hypothetical protein